MKGSIENLVKGFKKASDIIHMEKPDVVFAPVVGAVPFIDILKIVDRKFPLEIVEYPPNSSRFRKRDELMSRWYDNFFEEYETDEELKIICLDEVLSGASAVKGYRQFRKSLEQRALKKSERTGGTFEDYRRQLAKHLSYKIIGFAEKGHHRNNTLNRLANKGHVHLINFEYMPTIDNVLLNYVRLKPAGKNTQGRMDYLPEVQKFDVTMKYIDFLKDIATYVGADPDKVGPVNLSKIQNSLSRAKK